MICQKSAIQALGAHIRSGAVIVALLMVGGLGLAVPAAAAEPAPTTTSATQAAAPAPAPPAAAATPTTSAAPTAAPAAPAPQASTEDQDDAGGQSVVWAFLRIGFNHIIPEGLDHILFVLGLFLLAPRFKPLLIQVTAFTVAHSITLGLCMADIVHLPSRLVETTIAASIAFVAIENIFYKDLKPWRWMVVFCFGLIHGLGFASALKELPLPHGSFFPILISFNVGVELGQLTVIAVAAALTVWFWKKSYYRKVIVIPGSVIIACVGLYWAVQRAFDLGS
jgi:hypothetical protein